MRAGLLVAHVPRVVDDDGLSRRDTVEVLVDPLRGEQSRRRARQMRGALRLRVQTGTGGGRNTGASPRVLLVFVQRCGGSCGGRRLSVGVLVGHGCTLATGDVSIGTGRGARFGHDRNAG